MIGEQGGFGLVSLLRGLLGIITILGIAYAMSYDRKRIDWKLVGGGLFMQIVFALAVLYVPFVGSLLEGCGKIFVKLMDFTDAGLTFLLGPYASKAAGFSFLLATDCYFLLRLGFHVLPLGDYPESSRCLCVGIA